MGADRGVGSSGADSKVAEPAGARLAPPEYLSAVEKKLFRKLAKHYGGLRAKDVPALARYCCMTSMFRQEESNKERRMLCAELTKLERELERRHNREGVDARGNNGKKPGQPRKRAMWATTGQYAV